MALPEKAYPGVATKYSDFELLFTCCTEPVFPREQKTIESMVKRAFNSQLIDVWVRTPLKNEAQRF